MININMFLSYYLFNKRETKIKMLIFIMRVTVTIYIL